MIYKKSQHHQHDKNYAEIFFAKTKVVAKLIALIFQGVASLILNLPPGTGTSHELIDVIRSDIQVGNPAKTENFLLFRVILPVFDKGKR